MTTSAMPVPKYAMGQPVFRFYINQTTTPLPCPDCRGEKTWTVTTRAGESIDVPCGRCQRTYGGKVETELYLAEWRPVVECLTVGQIRIEWPVVSTYEKDPIYYMAEETGVGSGSLYLESQLYPTEAEARAAADVELVANRLKRDAEPKTKWTLALAAQSIVNAVKLERSNTVWAAGYHFGQLQKKVQEWLEKDSEFAPSEEQRHLLEYATTDDLRYHMDPKNNPLVALVQAVRRGDDVAALLKQFDFVPEVPTEILS